MSGTQNFSGYYDLYMFKSCMPLRHWLTVDLNCVCPPQKGFCLRPHPPPPQSFQLSLTHFFKFFGLMEPQLHTPRKSNPFCGGSMNIFWTCTMCIYQCDNFFSLKPLLRIKFRLITSSEPCKSLNHKQLYLQ